MTPTPLSRSGVANDACVDASVIAGVPYASTVSSNAATREATDPAPSCGNHSTGKSL